MIEFDRADAPTGHQIYPKYQTCLESNNGKSWAMTQSQWNESKQLLKDQLTMIKQQGEQQIQLLKNARLNSKAIDRIIKKLDDVSTKLDGMNK